MVRPVYSLCDLILAIGLNEIFIHKPYITGIAYYIEHKNET